MAADLHVPLHEGPGHPQHVRVLDQLQQVLPQFLLVLGDFPKFHLQLLQLLLRSDSSHGAAGAVGSVTKPATQH